MLSLIIAESALELVPQELQKHNSVLASAKRLGKKPSDILLDVSWHFAAMKGIQNEMKRGRPDLIHFSLLEASSIPLYYENRLQIFVHTVDDKVIRLGKGVRLPKSYHRFEGLVEKLYVQGRIEEDHKSLLEIKEMSFEELICEICPKHVIGLSHRGTRSSYQHLAKKLDENSCVVIGGFAKGQFSNRIKKFLNELVSVDRNPLEAHIVVSRVLYEYEKRIIM